MTTIAQLRAAGLDLVIPSKELPEPLAAPEAVLNPSSLSRWPEEVYNMDQDSHLVRLLTALAGDAGAGALKKQMLIPKLQQTLDSTHFQDLDLLYGSPLGLPRLNTEAYDFNPQVDVLTQLQWQEVKAKDADYRARCLIWMRAVMHGATVQGIALAAQAALGVECDVVERYHYLENLLSDFPMQVAWTSSFEEGGFYDTNNPTFFQWSYALTGTAAAPTISSDTSHGLAADGSNYLAATSTGSASNSVTVTTHEYIRVNTAYPYTFTAFWRRATGTGDPKGFMQVACFNEAGGSTGTVYPTHAVSGIANTPAANGLVNPHSGVAATTFDRWGGSVAVTDWPANTVKVKLQIAPYGVNSVVGMIHVDAVQFQQGDQATIYGLTVPGQTKAMNEAVIVPQIPDITDEEHRRVLRLVDRLRPVDCLPTIQSGSEIRSEKPPCQVAASSSNFNVQRLVIGQAGVTWPNTDMATGYWIVEGEEQEAPTQAFQDGSESASFLAVHEVVASSEAVGYFNAEQRSLFPPLAAVSDGFDVHSASRAYAKGYTPLQVTGAWIDRG